MNKPECKSSPDSVIHLASEIPWTGVTWVLSSKSGIKKKMLSTHCAFYFKFEDYHFYFLDELQLGLHEYILDVQLYS